MRIVRKRLSEEEMNAITDIRQTSGQLEMVRGNTGIWENVPNADNVRRDGSTMTGDLTMASGGATGGKININPATNQRAINIQLPATAGDVIRAMNASTTTIFSVNNIGRFALRGSDNNMFGVSDAAGALAMLIGTVAGNPILTLTGRASQSTDIYRVFNSAGVLLAAISQAGAGTFTGSARLTGQSSTTTRDMAMWRSVWEVSTDATRKAQAYLTVFDNVGEREIFRGGTDGASAKIGFLGASPVLRQVVSGDRQQNPAVQSMLTALVNMGLITDTTTAGTLPVDGASAELRVSGGYIQWRQSDDSPTWANLIALPDLQGAQGIQGIQGIQGEPGLDGANGECEDCHDSPAPVENNNNALCGAATYIVDHIDNLFDDFLTKVVVAADVAGVIGDLLSFFGPTAVILGNLASLIQDALFLGTDGMRAAVTTEVLEDMQCQLYCQLKADGDYTYTGLMAWHDAVLSDAIATNNYGLQVWIRIVDVLNANAWDQRAYIGSLDGSAACESLCDDCAEPDTWCYEWSAFDDWTQQSNGQGTLSTIFDIVYASTDITHIEFDYNWNGLGNGGAAAEAIWAGSALGMPHLAFVGDLDGQMVWDGSITTTGTTLGVNADGGSGGVVSITHILMRGTGTNPFGADNC